ncbi:unnamed protein product, partial [Mesorhabditis belari]|uniref:TIL domain-containing protein n=1 Tax=Mesorhabditis belari TaxID=2138241 RepID=A0AAF3FLU4_9BILA
MNRKLLVFLALALVCAASPEDDFEKPCADPNSIRKKAGSDPRCQENCDDVKAGRDPNNKKCNRKLYHNECYCKPGFVRQVADGEKCVDRTKC